MSHTGIIFVLIVVMSGTGVLAADSKSAFPRTPGYHRNVVVPSTNLEIDVYIPKSFAAEKGFRHPVVLVHAGRLSLVGDTVASGKVFEWAESVEAVVIAFEAAFTLPGHEPDPSRPPPPGIETVDRVIAFANTVRELHPTLRLLLGDNSSSDDGRRTGVLATRYSQQLAGVLIGPKIYGSETDLLTPGRDVSVVLLMISREAHFLTSASPLRYPESNDQRHRLVADRLRRAGNPFLYIESQGLNRHPEPVAEGLWWLLDAGYLNKAGVSRPERDTARKDIAKRMTGAAADLDSVERERRLRRYVTLPGLTRSELDAALKVWRATILPAGEARNEIIFRHDFWTEALTHPHFKGSAEARQVSASLQELQASPRGKAELDARELKRAISSTSLPLLHERNRAAIELRIQALRELISKYPGTLAANEAKDWCDFIEKRLENDKRSEEKVSAPRDPLPRR